MKQKDYKLEIIRSLLIERAHLRAMAKKLKTNQLAINILIEE